MFTIHFSVQYSVWFAARRNDSRSEAFLTLAEANAKCRELNALPA